MNPNTGTRAADNVVWIGYRAADATKRFSTLTAIIGAIPSHEPESQDIGDRLEEFTRLDANIRVAGDPDTIREAQRRWTIDQPLSPIAVKVRRLSQSYDNWFVLVKPFSVFAAMPADVADTTVPPLKYRHDLIDAVEEISGGIRFGTINEFYRFSVIDKSMIHGYTIAGDCVRINPSLSPGVRWSRYKATYPVWWTPPANTPHR